jgi:predicted RNA methylase
MEEDRPTLQLQRDASSNENFWPDSIEIGNVVLSIPQGLEVACMGIARRELGVSFQKLSDELIIAKKQGEIRGSDLLENAPIWTFGSFQLVYELKNGFELDNSLTGEIENAVQEFVKRFDLQGKRFWLNCPNDEPEHVHALKHFLVKSRNLSVKNDPTQYELTIRLHADAKKTYLLVGRSISVKKRFDYRKADVSVSINPVLAACLVRLIPRNLTGCVVDPTCGSGTLLIERLAYSKENCALGIDINPTAITAFNKNIDATGSEGLFSACLGDSSNSDLWPKCTSVICNLPFGIRVRAVSTELQKLYIDILQNALSNLDQDGRILLTSSFKRGLEQAVLSMGDRVHVLSKYKALMGGLYYQIVVLRKR